MVSSVSFYGTPKSYNSAKKEEVAAELVGSVFSKVFKDMYNSDIFKSDLLPKSKTEKWFKEMLIDQYSITIAKNNMKPLINEILKAYNQK
ncbi:rod-binding protein [Marinitoga aeolica]|uniref:Rod-binding protein n=1 Tax=Marinitoga aeolica TaxID=2809031 RepID=A0ABY8PT20_9BACT|nr:rod-binding protein [Marinitoga aeolica]WGS65780.1 rod-binding protein [Marinitoga aeolica]